MSTVHTSWLQPPKYIQAAILISIAGVLFGLDIGTIGPLTLMPEFAQTFGHLSSTVHGLVVSMILIPAAISSFFGGHVANTVGRLRCIAMGASIFGSGAAVEASSVSLGMLLAGRAVKGVGEGLFLSTSIVYITEISPPRMRGTLASIPQFFTTIGVCAGYFICYGSVNIPSSLSWRLPFAIEATISWSYLISSLLFLPESPRWLTACGRYREATAIWGKLGIEAAEREKIEERADSSGALPKPVEMRDILAVFGKHAWRQTSLGVFLMGMQQLTGIDGVLYYAPLLFSSAGLKSSTASFLASGISALLMFLVTIPAFLFADRWGRRTPTVIGGITQMICMFIIGSLYAAGAVHGDHGAARWVVIAMIYIFAIVFCATWAVSFRVYISEIQPAKTRAGAASLATSANWVVNWIVGFTTPIFLNKSPFGVYFMFGTAALITALVCIFFMPETRGKTLEDIDVSFRHKKLKNQIELKTPSGVIERNNMDDEREDSGMDEIRAVSSLSLV